jgi:hypothetical protein
MSSPGSRSARWARFGRRALPTERRQSADRPTGAKVARILAAPAGPEGTLLGLTVGGRYGSDAIASCEILEGTLPPPRRWGRRRLPPVHEVPDLDCTCGFYAFKDRSRALDLLTDRPPVSRLFGTFLLEVDLAGTIVEFDRGFRAARQRVLGVAVPPWCVACAADGEAARATTLAGLSGRSLATALQRELPLLPSAYRLALSVHHAALLDRLGTDAALRPVCDAHVDAADPEAGWVGETVALDLPELGARLGTEVSWLDGGALDVRGFVEARSWTPPTHHRVA